MNTFTSLIVLVGLISLSMANDCRLDRSIRSQWLGNAWFDFDVADVDAALERYRSVRDEASNDFWLRYDRKFVGGTANFDSSNGVFTLKSNNPDGVGDYEVAIVNYRNADTCSSFTVELNINGEDKIAFGVETELKVSGNNIKLTGDVWNCRKISGSGDETALCNAQKEHTWFAQFLQGCLIRGLDKEDCSVFADIWTEFTV